MDLFVYEPERLDSLQIFLWFIGSWANHNQDILNGFLPQSGLTLFQAYSLRMPWAFVSRGIAPGFDV
jgi:hypothetical protein